MAVVARVQLQMKLMEFLLPEYETAKIEEAKNTPTVQVLDEAVARSSGRNRNVLFLFCSGAPSV
jgi:uncharacterized protein involved in exopolysaccharide biosynthesis